MASGRRGGMAAGHTSTGSIPSRSSSMPPSSSLPSSSPSLPSTNVSSSFSSKDSSSSSSKSSRCSSSSSARRAGGFPTTLSAIFVTAVGVVLMLGRGAEALSSGGHHSCSVFEDQTVKCWGLNGSGQLGLGDFASRGSLPSEMGDGLEEVNLGADFKAAGVSCGLDHSCAWTVGGRVKCWGGNAYGQLGHGDTTNRGGSADTMGDDLPFVYLGKGMSVLYAVAANHFTCVLLADETVKCFGRNDWGQLGSGDGSSNLGDSPNEMGDYLEPVQLVAIGANVTVSALAAHNGACAIMQSIVAVKLALKCWGPNGYGSLGLGDSFNRGDDSLEMGDYLPSVQLGTGEIPTSIVTGMDFVCVLMESGGVKCWGRNPNGQCGGEDIETYGDDENEMGDHLPFVDLGTGRTAVSLTAGEAHVCALLDDASVKCWGKGYYGQTGLESWHSVGQYPGQMGDKLPAIDLGLSTATATIASASSVGSRRLRGVEEEEEEGGDRALQATTTSEVLSLSAGGQRSCALIEGGSIKCWGYALAGGLGLGDSEDRGGRSGSMGDALPSLSLGTGKVAVAPAPAATETVAPTPVPTPGPTPAPTPEPTTVEATPPPADEATPEPTKAAADSETHAPTADGTASLVTARGGFEGLADDVGVSVTQGIAIAAGLPLLALLICCCAGYCIATKKKKEKPEQTNAAAIEASGGSRKFGTAAPAAPIAPASALGSRAGSRAGSHCGSLLGSRIGSRAASFYGPDGAEGLMATEGLFYAVTGPGGKKRSVDLNAGVFGYANGNSSVAGSELSGVGGAGGEGGTAGWLKGVEDRGNAEEGSNGHAICTPGSTMSGMNGTSNGHQSNGSRWTGNGHKAKNSASTPTFLRKVSSSDTPPNTWNRNDQVQPISGSHSFTPESHTAGSALSGHGTARSFNHSRNASAKSAGDPRGPSS